MTDVGIIFFGPTCSVIYTLFYVFMSIIAYRLLNTGLQSSECVIWAEALNSEHVLSRILWVSENTLNPQLIEKVSKSVSRESKEHKRSL